MKIAFDHQIFAFQEYGGVSRYVCQLAKNLTLQPGLIVKIFAPFHVNAYLAEMPVNLVKGHSLRNFPTPWNKYFSIAASKILVASKLRQFRPNIVHETYYSSLGYLPKGARRVITVHDMIHEKYTDMRSPWRFTHKRKRDAILRADHVICVSHATRADLLKYINVPEDKISVIHHGFVPQYYLREPVDGNIGNSRFPYILYVGSRSKYKNFTGAIRAFASSSILRENFNFFCFGGGNFNNDELELLRQLNLASGCVQLIQGDDTRLAELYMNARLFIYPSLYEGFGLPPLEAMSYGCPVVCSNTSSIPEVVGEAGSYFDPNDQSSMRSTLEQVALSDQKCSELVAAGYLRLALFSWKKCASETLAVYRRLLG